MSAPTDHGKQRQVIAISDGCLRIAREHRLLPHDQQPGRQSRQLFRCCNRLAKDFDTCRRCNSERCQGSCERGGLTAVKRQLVMLQVVLQLSSQLNSYDALSHE
jgi:hypothetical protein